MIRKGETNNSKVKAKSKLVVNLPKLLVVTFIFSFFILNLVGAIPQDRTEPGISWNYPEEPITGNLSSDNVKVEGAFAVGSNTFEGTSDGDINASTVNADAYVTKSPIPLCDHNDCVFFLPKSKKYYFVEKTDDWKVISITDN